MVIVYQVDKFTHNLLVEHFVAQSHIYPVFTGKVFLGIMWCCSFGSWCPPGFILHVVTEPGFYSS